jgi:hypothetical protein
MNYYCAAILVDVFWSFLIKCNDYYYYSVGTTVHNEPWPLLQLLTIGPNPVTFCLKFPTSVMFIPPSTESSHLIAGLPTCQVPSSLYRVNFLQRFSSCILKRCSSHLNHPALITFTMCNKLGYLFLSIKLPVPGGVTGPPCSWGI